MTPAESEIIPKLNMSNIVSWKIALCKQQFKKKLDLWFCDSQVSVDSIFFLLLQAAQPWSYNDAESCIPVQGNQRTKTELQNHKEVVCHAFGNGAISPVIQTTNGSCVPSSRPRTDVRPNGKDTKSNAEHKVERKR